MRGRRANDGAKDVVCTATVPLRPDGRLMLAVVADTHGAPHPDAARWIRALAPDAILHAGDIGDLRVLDALGELAPVIAVRGNIDARRPDLADRVTIDVRARETTVFRMLLLHIGVNGPRLRADARRHAEACGAQLVVCGHSHVPFLASERGLGVFNPGSVGPRRFQLPIVFGALEIADGGLRMRHIDCENGRTWTPDGAA